MATKRDRDLFAKFVKVTSSGGGGLSKLTAGNSRAGFAAFTEPSTIFGGGGRNPARVFQELAAGKRPAQRPPPPSGAQIFLRQAKLAAEKKAVAPKPKAKKKARGVAPRTDEEQRAIAERRKRVKLGGRATTIFS